MRTSSEIDQSLNRTLTILISAVIHAVLMVGICCSATEQKEKPIAVATKLIELKTLPAPPPPSPKPEPPSPKPEPPQPKPEPPQPKPEPPQPKPEPPKSKPEQPKPKPEPPKTKPEQPKPVVVKENVPKPAEKPKKNLTPREDFLSRFNNAEVKTEKPRPQPRQQPQTYTPPQPRTDSSRNEDYYKKKFSSRLSKNTPAAANPGAAYSGLPTTEQINVDYANGYVYPVLYAVWNPSSAGMKYKRPTPVTIAFSVTTAGVARNARITRQSNDPVMNNSVKELVDMINSGQIRFTPLQDAGIDRPLLQIEVTMHLEDK